MKLLVVAVLTFLSAFSASYASKIVCYYNNQAYWRKDEARTKVEHLKPALEHCDYLIYSFIGIDSLTYAAESLDPKLDLQTGKNYFKQVTSLKQYYPKLKILLSVGGYADFSIISKYLHMLETEKRMLNFVESVTKLAKHHGFDGVDLAYQFPLHKGSKPLIPSSQVWSTVSKYALFFLDDYHPAEHKEQFTLLCKELSAALQERNMTLTLTVLPNVNYQSYYDVDSLKDYVEQIHVLAFDYKTPAKLPNEADYATPLQYIKGRDPIENVDYTVKYFLNSSIPSEKIILGVSTYGKTWKLTTLSGESPVPPLNADGPGDAGPVLKESGKLAYYEICKGLSQDAPHPLTRVSDPYGVTAYHLPKHFWNTGIWISYEDKESVANKADYAKEKGLGGVALVDLSLDDFRGLCEDPLQTYPLLKSVKNKLKSEEPVDIRVGTPEASTYDSTTPEAPTETPTPELAPAPEAPAV